MTEDEAAQLQRIEDKLDSILALLVDGEIPAGIRKRPAAKRVTVVDNHFRFQMLQDFQDSLGDEKTIHHQIDLALAHKAASKYNDQQTYVRNWLNNAVKYREAHAPVSVSNDRDKYLADYERRYGGLPWEGDQQDQESAPAAGGAGS